MNVEKGRGFFCSALFSFLFFLCFFCGNLVLCAVWLWPGLPEFLGGLLIEARPAGDFRLVEVEVIALMLLLTISTPWAAGAVRALLGLLNNSNIQMHFTYS